MEYTGSNHPYFDSIEGKSTARDLRLAREAEEARNGKPITSVSGDPSEDDFENARPLPEANPPTPEEIVANNAEMKRAGIKLALVAVGVLSLAQCLSMMTKDPKSERSSDSGRSVFGTLADSDTKADVFAGLEPKVLSSRPQQVNVEKYNNVDSHEEIFESIRAGLMQNGALVVAANQTQYIEAIAYIRRYNGRRVANRGPLRLRFQRVNRANGREIGTKIRVPVGRSNITIYVIKAEDVNTREGQQFTGRRKFSVVQGRGHSDDMNPAIQAARPNRAEESLLDLGGCSSRSFKQSQCSPKTPTITQNGTGIGIRNSKTILRIVEELPRSRSWEQMYARIQRLEPATTGIENNMPGQPGYGSDCYSWNQASSRVTRQGALQVVRDLEGQRENWRKFRSHVREVKDALNMPFINDKESALNVLLRQEEAANQEVGKLNRLIAIWKKKRRNPGIRRRVVVPSEMNVGTRTQRNRRRRRRGRRTRRSRRR